MSFTLSKALTVPAGWKLTRLGYLVERRQEVGRPELEPLSVFLDAGVVPRASRDDNFNRLGADMNAYLVVKPGDIVFNKLRTWQGGVGVSRYEGIVSPAYFVCRPHSVEPRFLHYLLRSHIYLHELTRISKWMPPSQFDIGWEDLKLLPILEPPIHVQQEIVAFLDREMAHSDALIAAKRQMVDLLLERKRAIVDEWACRLSERFGTVPLRRMLDKIEQGWSPECDVNPAEEGEWGVIKTSAVTSGVFVPTENKRLPLEMPVSDRWVIKDEDLLVVRGSGSRGSVGQAAVAEPGGRRLLLSDLVYRLVPRDGNSHFLAAILRSPRVREVMESMIRTDAGQTLKLRGDDLKGLPIPAVPTSSQQDEWVQLKRMLVGVETTIECMNHQIRLILEHRKALITTSVTGALEPSGAAA